MSSLSPKSFSSANLFETLILYRFLTYSSLNFLRLNLSTSNQFCLLTYCQSFPNFCNHQIVISITVSSSEISYTEYTRKPSFVYLCVINMIFSFPTRRGPGVFMNFSVWEHRDLNYHMFLCSKVYHSNTIIITILM